LPSKPMGAKPIMKRIAIYVTPEFHEAATLYKAALDLPSLSAAVVALAVLGLRQEGMTIQEARKPWGGPRWEGDTRPLDER